MFECEILSICSGLVQAEQTPKTSDVAEKAIIASINNPLNCPYDGNLRLWQNFFEIFQKFFNFLLPRTLLKGYLNET